MAHTTNDAAIQQVLRQVLVLNLLVAFGKLAVGFMTGTLSIIADGFHSLIDATSNLIAIIAQAIAARPPDENHPYGHRRFESVATFVIGGFLMLVAWEVLNAAVERLRSGEAPEVLPISFAVLITTLIINIFVSSYERRRGQALRSQILIADASQTFTDIFVTISVLISLGLAQMGYGWMDGVIALVIVVLIGRMGWQIINEATQVLVDAAPLPAAKIEQVARNVPQVGQVVRVRNRSSGEDIFVDLDVQVRPEITADHAHQIALTINDEVKEQFPQVKEVRVSFEPQNLNGQADYALIARAAADGLGLGVHEIIPIFMDEGVILEMHVEVDPGLSLAAAHRQVCKLEANLMKHPPITQVITHIEPQGRHGSPFTHSQKALQMRDEALALAKVIYPAGRWHDATIRLMLGGYALTVICDLPGTVSVEDAHQIAEQVETRIRVDLPYIQRVTIHTEPI